MDTPTLLFGLSAFTMAGVTWHAWRLGNEKRDVTLLGTIAGLCGAGTAVVAVF